MIVGHQSKLGPSMHDQAVQQLQFIGRERRCQSQEVGIFGVDAGGVARHRLSHRKLLQALGQLLQH